MNLQYKIYREPNRITDVRDITDVTPIMLELYSFIHNIENLNRAHSTTWFSYFLLTDEEYLKCKEFCVQLNEKFELEDITDAVLNGKYSIEFDNESSDCGKIFFKDEFFELKDFIYKYEKAEKDLNYVLDKISNDGIESLTVVDKEILENF